MSNPNSNWIVPSETFNDSKTVSRNSKSQRNYILHKVSDGSIPTTWRTKSIYGAQKFMPSLVNRNAFGKRKIIQKKKREKTLKELERKTLKYLKTLEDPGTLEDLVKSNTVFPFARRKRVDRLNIKKESITIIEKKIDDHGNKRVEEKEEDCFLIKIPFEEAKGIKTILIAKETKQPLSDILNKKYEYEQRTQPVYIRNIFGFFLLFQPYNDNGIRMNCVTEFYEFESNGDRDDLQQRLLEFMEDFSKNTGIDVENFTCCVINKLLDGSIISYQHHYSNGNVMWIGDTMYDTNISFEEMNEDVNVITYYADVNGIATGTLSLITDLFEKLFTNEDEEVGMDASETGGGTRKKKRKTKRKKQRSKRRKNRSQKKH